MRRIATRAEPRDGARVKAEVSASDEPESGLASPWREHGPASTAPDYRLNFKTCPSALTSSPPSMPSRNRQLGLRLVVFLPSLILLPSLLPILVSTFGQPPSPLFCSLTAPVTLLQPPLGLSAAGQPAAVTGPSLYAFFDRLLLPFCLSVVSPGPSQRVKPESAETSGYGARRMAKNVIALLVH